MPDSDSDVDGITRDDDDDVDVSILHVCWSWWCPSQAAARKY